MANSSFVGHRISLTDQGLNHSSLTQTLFALSSIFTEISKAFPTNSSCFLIVSRLHIVKISSAIAAIYAPTYLIILYLNASSATSAAYFRLL